MTDETETLSDRRSKADGWIAVKVLEEMIQAGVTKEKGEVIYLSEGQAASLIERKIVAKVKP